MILEKVNYPEDIKNLDFKELEILAQELRNFILEVVAKNGGHLAPSLGTIELTLALLKVFNPPTDKLVWDVGHQSYAYKILTGRKDKFYTLRQYNGIAGFNKISESVYDAFTVGHAGTSISAALGIAKAREVLGEKYKVVAIIGDGSLSCGLAMEGLNNAGSSKSDLLVILNDNGMSIDKNVGAISNYLTNLIVNKTYNYVKEDIDKILDKIFLGNNLKKGISTLKSFFMQGQIFEDFGFRYFGPIDGHDIEKLTDVLENLKDLKGPKLLHIKTIKGKGYKPAEKDATKFHGLGAFEQETGKLVAIDKEKTSFSKVAASSVLKVMEQNKATVAITAAMPSGTGSKIIGEKFPERFFDVGIAEGHAVTFAAGLATKKVVPYVFIYSTFLQRAYDNIIHDVALERLPVVFCVDRAGIVGEDGPTHHGVFDISYFGSIPNITLWAPESLGKLESMIEKSYNYALEHGPLAIRYPRASLNKEYKKVDFDLLYKKEVHKKHDVAILTVGYTYQYFKEIEEQLSKEVDLYIIDKLFPLDVEFFDKIFHQYKKIITIEENVYNGSFSSVLFSVFSNTKAKKMAITLPNKFIEHGERNLLLEIYGIKGNKLAENINSFIDN